MTEDKRDAKGGELGLEPDVVLEAMVASDVGQVSETTRELARLELDRRAFLARARAESQ